MNSRLMTVAAAALPAVALATGAVSLEARAADASSYVAIAAADAMAMAIVTRENGETIALPLGPSDAVASLVNAREAIALAEGVTPVLIGNPFTAESPGS